MTARERDPQGASGPPADLTRLEAIRERLAKATRGPWIVGPLFDQAREILGEATGPFQARIVARLIGATVDTEYFIAHAWEDIAWLLARLAPATPPDAATAGDARVPMCACGHAKLSHPFGLSGYVAFTGDCWGCDCKTFAPASAERSGAAPADLEYDEFERFARDPDGATAAGAGETESDCFSDHEGICTKHGGWFSTCSRAGAAPPAAGSRPREH